MHINTVQREVTLKVVYYGPPLSGKTTNLQALHRLLPSDATNRLTVLDTADDRTLFFDLLPLSATTPTGFRIKLKLFTVPGQVVHVATRRIVLAGADAVVFVADSQRSASKVNNQFWRGMRTYLQENGIDPDAMPKVIQFNKRDLPDARSDEEIDEVRRKGSEPVYGAVAIRGEGVRETFDGMLALLFANLNRKYNFERQFGINAEQFRRAVCGGPR